MPRNRLPAEWEPQDAVMLAWPHAATDWAPQLAEVTRVYLELTRQIGRFTRVLIVTGEAAKVADELHRAGINPDPVRYCPAPTDDTWIRDFGPLSIYRDGAPVLLDFIFDGWGGKFPATRDNRVSAVLHRRGCFGATARHPVNLVLEGGSIEVDGRGTLLTTSRCLLHAGRNPHLQKDAWESLFSELFGIRKILWLDHGALAGDDTDSHIDTLVRFAPDNTLLYVSCDDPADEHFPELQRMQRQLATFTNAAGEPFRMQPLPWPRPCYADGARLPAGYANFLVINRAVLVPIYGDPAADRAALDMLGRAFPGREPVPIDCRTLIRQHGSLHCITMQLPQGVLS